MTEPTDDETGNGDDCVPANGHEHCFIEAIRLRDQIKRITKDRDEANQRIAGIAGLYMESDEGKLKAELKEAVTTAQQATGLLDIVTGLAEHLAEKRHLMPVEKRVLKSATTFLEEKP